MKEVLATIHVQIKMFFDETYVEHRESRWIYSDFLSLFPDEIIHVDDKSDCPVMCVPAFEPSIEDCNITTGICSCKSNGQALIPYITHDGQLAKITHSKVCPSIVSEVTHWFLIRVIHSNFYFHLENFLWKWSFGSNFYHWIPFNHGSCCLFPCSHLQKVQAYKWRFQEVFDEKSI